MTQISPKISRQFQSLREVFEAVLDLFFRIHHISGLIRTLAFLFFILTAWIIIAFFTHGIPDLSTPVPGFGFGVQPYHPIPILRFVPVFLSWQVLMHLLAILVPVWLVLRAASIYLDDIFELGKRSIARQFILQSAFALAKYRTIHIENGNLRSTDRNSSIIKIGGPGKGAVYLENVALFERVNGSCEIVGPTVKGTYRIEGFMRLRKTFDLRDQTIEISEISERTSDGIEVSARSIRLLFSIRRRPGSKNLTLPYKFSRSAILWLVYQQTSGPWILAVQKLVQEKLRDFIRSHTLSEFLAAFYPIDAQDLPGISVSNSIPRPEVSDMYNFTKGFPLEARQHGIHLEWIDIGTWHTPVEIIPSQYTEAWKLTIDNIKRSNPRSREENRKQARIQEITRLTRAMMIDFVSLNQSHDDPGDVIFKLIDSFDTKISSLPKQEPANSTIDKARTHIARYKRNYLESKGIPYIGQKDSR